MLNTPDPHPLDIPPFLKRDPVTNESEFTMSTEVAESATESRPAKGASKTKLNGTAKPVKASAKAEKDTKPAKAKAEATKAKAKAGKAPEKGKAVKPKAEASKKDKYGLREGSAKSKAAALYARKEGATLKEVEAEVGSIQLNVLVGLEAEGYTVVKKKEEREGQRPATRYWLKGKK